MVAGDVFATPCEPAPDGVFAPGLLLGGCSLAVSLPFCPLSLVVFVAGYALPGHAPGD